MLNMYLLTCGGMMTLMMVACEGGIVIENEDIPLPTAVLLTSSAFDLVLRWNFSNSSYENISFDVDWQRSSNWFNECTEVKEQQCNMLGILQEDQGILCTEEKTLGRHLARVRACIQGNATQTDSRRCSGWAISNLLDLPADDELPQPNFEIYGVFDRTELRVIGFPVPVKYSNKSLNCYHSNRLFSEIRFYWKDDNEEVLVVEYDNLNISLLLPEKNTNNSEFCVRMRITNALTNKAGSWKEKCTTYKPDVIPVPTEVFLSSSNINIVLGWKFPYEEFANVYFEVEGHVKDKMLCMIFAVRYEQNSITCHLWDDPIIFPSCLPPGPPFGNMGSSYREWLPECKRTSEHSCNIANTILRDIETNGCPDNALFGRYTARVRACFQKNQTRKCSDWAMSKVVALPNDDKLPLPEFEIEGIYGSKILQILTTPVLFTHISLNCWYGKQLRYEMKLLYGSNDSLSDMVPSKSIDERRLSFPLQYEHLAGPRLCVEMRITRDKTEAMQKYGSWNKQCVEIYPNILMPTDLELSSVNLNLQLKWNLPKRTGNEIFYVEACDDFYQMWGAECTRTEANYCSLTKALGEQTDACPDYFFMQKYKARVRTCVQFRINATEKCSAWAISDFLEIPEEDVLPKPDFNITISTKLQIRNVPHVVKHSNKSLNCYYANRLKYEIVYYGKNGSLAIEGDSASFDSQQITLPLNLEDLDGREICVRMRMRDPVKNKNGSWNEKCVVYEKEHSTDMSLLTGISTSVSFAMVLGIVLCVFRGLRFYKSFYLKELEIPKELVDIMNDFDGLDVHHSSTAEIIDSVNCNDSISIKCELVIRKQSFSSHSMEVVNLFNSSKIKVSSEDVNAEFSPRSAELNTEEERSSEDSNWGINTPDDIYDDSDPISTPYDSRSESIPYIYSALSTDDRQGCHGSVVSVSQILDDATDEIRIPNSRQSNLQNSRTYYPIKCLSETNLLKAKLQEIIEPVSYYIKRACGLDKTTKAAIYCETANSRVSTMNLNGADSLVTTEPPITWPSDSRLVSKTSDCYTTLSEIMLSQIKDKKSSNGNIDANTADKILANVSNADLSSKVSTPSTQSKLEVKEHQAQKRDEGLVVVSIDNPTYNPNPTAFDFMDKIYYKPMSKIYDKVQKYPWLQKEDSTELVCCDYKNEPNYTYVSESSRAEDFDESYSTCRHLSRKLPLRDIRSFKSSSGRQDDSWALDTRQADGFKTFPIKCKKNSSAGVADDSCGKSRNLHRSRRRHHSCDSSSITLSPFRDRIMSIDSGYYMGSSFADESSSLSPPISPVDIMFPDVFSTADDFSNKLLLEQLDQTTYVDTTPNRDAFRHPSVLSHILGPAMTNTARWSNLSVEMLPTLTENDIDETQMPSYVRQIQEHNDQRYMKSTEVCSNQDENSKNVVREYIPYNSESISADYLDYAKVSKSRYNC